MDTYDMDGRRDWAADEPVLDPQTAKLVFVSADDHLRATVFQSIQDAGLPIRVQLDLAAPVQYLEPEHLERLRGVSPHIVVLDMADEPERAIRVASAIASGSPRAALVGAGPELESSRLLDALGRVLSKRGWGEAHDGHRNGKLLAFFSAKGGSGCTSVVTNVGIELHRLTGRRTLLVDLDLELGEIASLLGVRPRFHFVDLVRNFHRMDADLLPSYIESHESGVHVLSAPFEPEHGEVVTGEQIARVLGFLRKHYDYVLVDTSKSLSPPALAALQTADPIFLVTNMDVPSLRNLKRCLPILDRVTAGEPERLRLIVNRYNPKSLVRLEDLEETLGIEVSWTLSNDYETVIQAISTGQPIVLQGQSKYADELKELARDIVHGAPTATKESKGLMGRLLSPFRTSSTRAARARAPMNGNTAEVVSHG
jgi:Flp pilus assembly CpaE family ATPase